MLREYANSILMYTLSIRIMTDYSITPISYHTGVLGLVAARDIAGSRSPAYMSSTRTTSAINPLVSSISLGVSLPGHALNAAAASAAFLRRASASYGLSSSSSSSSDSCSCPSHEPSGDAARLF